MDADGLLAALKRHLSAEPGRGREEAFPGGLRFEHEGRMLAVTDRQVLDALATIGRASSARAEPDEPRPDEPGPA